MLLRYEAPSDPVALWTLQRELKALLRPKAKTPPAKLLDLYLQIGMLTIEPHVLEDCDQALTRLAEQVPLPMGNLLQIALFRVRCAGLRGEAAAVLPPLQEALLLTSLIGDQELQGTLAAQMARLHLELYQPDEALSALEHPTIPHLWADAYRAWALHLQGEHAAVEALLIGQLLQWSEAPVELLAVVYWLAAEHLLATNGPIAAVTLAREANAHATTVSDLYVIQQSRRCLRQALKAIDLPS